MKRALLASASAAAFLAACAPCAAAPNYAVVPPARVVNGVLGFPYSGSQMGIGTPGPGGAFTLLPSATPAFSGDVACPAGSPATCAIDLTDPFDGSIRRLASQIMDTTSLRSGNVKCDGVTDDTAAINARLALLVGQVFIPGKCRVSGPVTIANAGTTLYAAPFSGNGFVTTSPTADVLVTTQNFVSLIGLTINTTVARTAGAYFKATPVYSGNSGRYEIAQVDMDDPYTGLDFEGPSSVVHVSHSRAFFFNQKPAVGCSAITYNPSGPVVDFNVDWFDAYSQTGANRCDNGLLATGGGDVAINNSGFSQFNRALYVHVMAGQTLPSLRSSNTYYDSSGISGVDLFADGGTILRGDFVQSWASSAVTGDGFYVHTANDGVVNGLDLIQIQAFGNAGNGVNFADAGVSNAHVGFGAFAGNGACGVNDGPNSGFEMSGATSGAVGGFLQNKYGVCVALGATNFRVLGNDLRNDSTAATNILPPLTSSEIVEGNVGFTPPCTPYTVTLTPSAGYTITPGTVAGCYHTVGKQTFVKIDAQIAQSSGSGAGSILATLPVPADSVQTIMGHEVSVTGALIQGNTAQNSSQVNILTPTGGYPGGAGFRLELNGWYQTP